MWLESIAGPPVAVTAQLAPDPDPEPGFLELLATMEVALPKMAEHLQAIDQLIEQMGQLALDRTPAMQRAATAGAKLLLTNNFAEQLEPLAEDLETVVGAYADSIKQADPGFSYLLDRIEADELTVDEVMAATQFLTATAQTGEMATTTMVSTSTFADTMLNVGSASRKLREPSARIARAMRRLVEATETVQRWSERAVAALKRLPPQGIPA